MSQWYKLYVYSQNYASTESFAFISSPKIKKFTFSHPQKWSSIDKWLVLRWYLCDATFTVSLSHGEGRGWVNFVNWVASWGSAQTGAGQSILSSDNLELLSLRDGPLTLNFTAASSCQIPMSQTKDNLIINNYRVQLDFVQSPKRETVNSHWRLLRSNQYFQYFHFSWIQLTWLFWTGKL